MTPPELCAGVIEDVPNTKQETTEESNKMISVTEKAGSSDDNSRHIQLLFIKFSMTLQNKLENEEQLQWAQKHELLNHLGDFLYKKKTSTQIYT